jgi:hypothetical protein
VLRPFFNKLANESIFGKFGKVGGRKKTHSTNLPHHDKPTALLARANDPQDQALGHSEQPAENGQFDIMI